MVSRTERFKVFPFFLMAFLIHSSLYPLFVVSKLYKHSRIDNSRLAIGMFLQFIIEILLVCFIKYVIRFFHLVSYFLKAIDFSKISVSLACLSLFITVMISGIVTPLQWRYISRAVSHHMYRFLLVWLQCSFKSFRYCCSSISSGLINSSGETI